MRFPLSLLFLASALSALFSCTNKKADSGGPPEPVKDTVFQMVYSKYANGLPGQQQGLGYTDIIFTADGRAAALSTKKQVFFSKDGGTNWTLVYQFSDINDRIQSLALHPTENILFVGGKRLGQTYHYIFKAGADGQFGVPDEEVSLVWDGRNSVNIPAEYNYMHSYWYEDNVFNCFGSEDGMDGMLSIITNPENTNDTPDNFKQNRSSSRPFYVKAFVPLYNYMFLASGYEMIQGFKGPPGLHQFYVGSGFEWIPFQYAIKQPVCCAPDHVSVDAALSTKTNQVFLYSNLKKIYHTRIIGGAPHQNEIVIPEQVYGTPLCTGIDKSKHLWIGTSDGLFRSTAPLPE